MRDTASCLLADRLGELRSDYGASLPGRLERLRARAKALIPDADNAAALESIRAELHLLAGSAATFGFPRISDEAQALERFVASLIQSRHALSPAEARMVQLGLDEMAAQPHTPDQPAPTARLAVISANPGEALQARLRELGYHPVAIDPTDEAAAWPSGTGWRGILADTDCPTDQISACVAHLRAQAGMPVPCVGYAPVGGFAARYAAAKLGAVGFLADPTRMEDLPAALQRFLDTKPPAPFRVLYLGQTAPKLKAGAFLLQAGQDATLLLEQIGEFRPELLLLSMDQPHYGAVELARMVWQDAPGREIDIFFQAKDVRAGRDFTARGITDAYVIADGDAGAGQAHMLRYLHERRAGLRAPNSADLGPALLRWQPANAGPEAQRAPALIAADGVAAPATAPVRARSKILIVDDDRFLVSMLAHALSLRGAEILRAHGGEQGYVTAWQEMPTAIITDIEMPDGNGERLILQLRSNPRTRNIPVIVMTGRRWEGGRDYALEREMRGRLGAAAYLQKPVEVETLVKELARL